MRQASFPNGMTVPELKALLRDWPDADEDGNPCEVWLIDVAGMSVQLREVCPLNQRCSEDGTKSWADLCFEIDEAWVNF